MFLFLELQKYYFKIKFFVVMFFSSTHFGGVLTSHIGVWESLVSSAAYWSSVCSSAILHNCKLITITGRVIVVSILQRKHVMNLVTFGFTDSWKKSERHEEILRNILSHGNDKNCAPFSRMYQELVPMQKYTNPKFLEQ